jgi:hypothetical protein
MLCDLSGLRADHLGLHQVLLERSDIQVAGFPDYYRVADKSGTGRFGANSQVRLRSLLRLARRILTSPYRRR